MNNVPMLNALRSRVALLSFVVLAGCAAATAIAKVVEQAACTIVPIVDPSSQQLVAAVCQEVAPEVTALVGELAGAGLPSQRQCKFVPVTPDGATGVGEACAFLCGAASPSPSDPCPAVDARLARSPAAKALVAARKRGAR